MKSIITLAILLLSFGTFAQDTTNTHRHGPWCGAHDALNKQLSSNLQFIENLKLLNTYNPTFDASSRNITIPVVVHVVYRDSSQIPSMKNIKAQIEGLTNDFTAENHDFDNISDEFAKLGADFNITFKLATVSPSGKKTKGVTYTKTDEPYFTYYDDVKAEDTGGKLGWNSRNYLNIWVCKLESNLLGYAQFPGGNPITDGVVVTYSHFGINHTDILPNSSEVIHYYRVLTHEVGHWVGLYHIWGDWVCGDDKVKDTPSQIGPHWECYDEYESCGGADLTVNYMDYVDDDCMYMFTKGQKKRAWKALKLFRKEMLKSKNQKLTE
jgi:hypothetical protein